MMASFRLVPLLALAPVFAGCAYVEQRFTDVTDDPRFQVGYRAGEVYRLREDASLVACGPDECPPGRGAERLELWPAEAVARRRGKDGEPDVVAAVPAGALVRVDGLEHNDTFAVPPVPGDTQILRAYGTVSSPAATWARVRMPDDPDAAWSRVDGTYVMACPPDHDLLERVPADRWPAAGLSPD